MNQEELAVLARGMRLVAQQSFRDGTQEVIDELQRFAGAAEKALGEISVEEAWDGFARTAIESIGKHSAVAK